MTRHRFGKTPFVLFALDIPHREPIIFCVSAPVFPDLIKIDEEIRALRLTLKNPELSPRHRKAFSVLLDHGVKKRRKLLDGINKRV